MGKKLITMGSGVGQINMVIIGFQQILVLLTEGLTGMCRDLVLVVIKVAFIQVER
jgi:hypothetical protein